METNQLAGNNRGGAEGAEGCFALAPRFRWAGGSVATGLFYQRLTDAELVMSNRASMARSWEWMDGSQRKSAVNYWRKDRDLFQEGGRP